MKPEAPVTSTSEPAATAGIAYGVFQVAVEEHDTGSVACAITYTYLILASRPTVLVQRTHSGFAVSVACSEGPVGT